MGSRGDSSFHKMDERGSIGCEAYYSRINSTKFPDLGAANISEPRLVLEVGRLHEVVYAYRSVCFCNPRDGGALFFCLYGSCSHVTEVGGSLGL